MKDWLDCLANTNTHSHPIGMADVQQITSKPSRKSTAFSLFHPVMHVFVIQFTDDAVFMLCPCMGCAAAILAVYHWSAMSSSSLYVRLRILDPMATIEAWNTWTQQHMVATVELQKKA